MHYEPVGKVVVLCALVVALEAHCALVVVLEVHWHTLGHFHFQLEFLAMVFPSVDSGCVMAVAMPTLAAHGTDFVEVLLVVEVTETQMMVLRHQATEQEV